MSYSIVALVLSLVVLSRPEPLQWTGDFEETPFSSEDILSRNVQYRLPTNVIPLKYDIHIDLHFSENIENPFSYDGYEKINIKATEESVSEIVLHANVDTIHNVTLFTEDDDEVTITDYDTESLYHFLRIRLPTPLVVDNVYVLHINYTSTMNDGPMKRGIWKGWYIDENNEERIYATTHFQPYNARQAFPCWDEPLFKAVFQLHLTRPENYSATFSNTQKALPTTSSGGRVTDHFLPTPVMSSYLVTFLVSESFTVIAEDTSLDPPLRIIGRSNAVGLGDQALKLAVGMTKYFDDYFDMPYSTLDPNLLNDHVSSPDWASAGTENWGMVSYRELHLLIDFNTTISSVEHYGVTLVSHELAHKWFGNYITCYWWSNTWINEGYASMFGYLAAHEVFPEYELHDHFTSRYLQNSLSFDSGLNTVPLNHDVNTPAQVTGHFGTISYSKAAAFLRMTANMITMDTFKKSCRYFLKNNPYKATDQYDLFEAFAQAVEEDGTLDGYLHFNFTHYYDTWVNQPGYPILSVDVDHSTGEMALSQERFYLSTSPPPSSQIYPIPITYSTRRQPRFSELKPSDMMTGDRMVLQKAAGEEWVIFNHQQQGHYRVTYNKHTWNLIADALLNERDSIHYLNRAQIVDDVFAFMRSNRMTYAEGFAILRFLRVESNYHVWNPAISGFTWLRNRIRHLPESLAEFDTIILSNMEHVINVVGFEPASNETPTVSMLRQEVLQFACTLGHKKCIEESVKRFTAMRVEQANVDRRIRRNVYMNGVREGNKDDFDFLEDRLAKSNIANDNLEMLRALGATKDPELLTRYLQLTLTRSVRSHDKVNAFNFALLGHSSNAATVLDFVMANIEHIRREFVEDSPANPVHTALSNLASYLDRPQLDTYESWVTTTQEGSAQYAGTINAINSARTNIQWGDDNADTILAAARDGATTFVVSAMLIVTTALFTVLIA